MEEGLTKSYRVAILGATGAVGTELLELLDRNFPLADLKLLASPTVPGVLSSFRGENLPVEPVNRSFDNVDLVLASAGGSTSKVWAPYCCSWCGSN